MPCASEDGVQHDDDVAESIERDAPIRLLLRCTECGHAERHGVPRAFVAPEPAVVDGGWDGILLHRIIRCGKCGAEDCYRVDPIDVQRLRERAESRTDAVVVRGVMTVLESRMVRRPSEAIRLIEDHLRAAPADPVRWVRLANARSLLHDPVGALAGWRRVLELAPDDIGSAVLVAHTTFRQGMVDDAVRDLNRALSLLPHLREWESSPRRASLSRCCSTSSMGWTHSIVTARLAFEPPDELSRLQRMLDYDGLERILGSVYDGDPGPLQRIVEDDAVDEYVRSAAVDAFLVAGPAFGPRPTPLQPLGLRACSRPLLRRDQHDSCSLRRPAPSCSL